MRIDHVTWFAPELSAANEYLASRLDCTPAYGGVHPGEGTCNSLVSLGEASYLEVLAFDPDQANPPGELASLAGQGVYHWAIGGVDLVAIKSRAARAGIETSDIVSGGRRLPDGGWIEWDTLGIARHGFNALVPFFIDWRECAHPATLAPTGGQLVNIELVTPRAAELRSLFACLDLNVAVQDGERPGIAVTIQTRRKVLVLRSFDPLPQGFVI